MLNLQVAKICILGSKIQRLNKKHQKYSEKINILFTSNSSQSFAKIPSTNNGIIFEKSSHLEFLVFSFACFAVLD
ncbi:MAG: hypothetical protein COV65_05095 [Nitrosopumilales archaeon CG11_big_fil_rev_8_21_14_0_20_33_24]|nr:MAG: hypothetical protein COV65_05095 [Nitrosopumilales archaeon CG11_big_fil_rev_8_21_14_0_20_33_24]